MPSAHVMRSAHVVVHPKSVIEAVCGATLLLLPQLLINILIMFPWSLVLLLSFLVNKWQLLFRAVGGLLWYGIDWLDQRVPNLVEWLLWFWYQISLMLHVLTVGINLGVIWVSADC